MTRSRQRAAAVFVLREAGLSYPAIAARLGIRHTTALYAQRRAVRLLRDDIDFGVLVDEARTAGNQEAVNGIR